MKKILAYFVLSIFTLISLQQVVLLGAFVFNQEYIIDKFCINKNKPELKCNGKCHLKDVISQSSTQTDEQQSSIISEIMIPFFYSDSFVDLSRKIFVINKYIIFEDVKESTYASNTFHPPQEF